MRVAPTVLVGGAGEATLHTLPSPPAWGACARDQGEPPSGRLISAYSSQACWGSSMFRDYAPRLRTQRGEPVVQTIPALTHGMQLPQSRHTGRGEG